MHNTAVKKLCTIIIGAALFALSHPNVLVSQGIAPLAFIALVPLFLLTKMVSVKEAALWGALYGALSTGLLILWLLDFSALAYFAIVVLYAVFFAVLLPVMTLMSNRFSRCGFLAAGFVYLAYEFLRTLGPLGFSYGVMGYSLWKWTACIQAARFFGVWIVSALLIFSAALLARLITTREGIKPKTKRAFYQSIYKEKKLLICYLVFLGFCMLPSLFPRRGANQKSVKIALVQPNSDPWKSGVENYGLELDKLIMLSERGIADGAELVVWPETAFIPRIKWHYRFRQDQRFTQLVMRLLEYVRGAGVSFLIGNDEAVFDAGKTLGSEDLEKGRVDYNAALLFTADNALPPEPDVYYKQRLVPFTETVPQPFGFLRGMLESKDTHFYNAGTVATVFEVQQLKFSVPICFEDTFGSEVRRFAHAGANLLINISNDAWSTSKAAQMQHLSTSVFRAVETGLPVLRSTATGVTAVIDIKGSIVRKLDSFTEDVLTVPVNVPEKSHTLYTRIGDAFGWLTVIIAAAFFITAIGKGLQLFVR